MFRLLSDLAGPFYDPALPFRNWSALPFYQLDLPAPPYVALERLERGVARAEAQLATLAEQGYTGVVVDNLPHLVTFDAAPERIYAAEDPCRLRALAYGEAFGRLFRAAARYGMEVFVTADMQWSTPALRRFVGRLDPGSPRLAAANAWAADELFARFPEVAGLFVRVGETGGAHDLGEDYTGHMLYRTPRALRALIAGLLPVCERRGRLLVVRTWSIGIGELGDLLWSPERYDAVFGGLASPHLLTSVKHVPADFFRHLPPNPTLGLPGPGQIVELQCRREYELFGMAPSGVARLHGRALATARAAGAAGVWAWSSTGGWGGGTAALGGGGWSVWTELSSALTAALARDPTADAAGLVRGWCAARFAAPDLAAAVAELYLASEELMEAGWYLGPLAGGRATLGGIALPTLLWTWWVRPTAAPLVWAYLAAAVPDIPACLAASRAALRALEQHAARLAELAPPGDAEAAFVATSARYLRDCVRVAFALRALFLPAFAAAAAGDRGAWRAALAAVPATLAELARHQATWGGRADFPALELGEVTGYLARLAGGAPDQDEGRQTGGERPRQPAPGLPPGSRRPAARGRAALLRTTGKRRLPAPLPRRPQPSRSHAERLAWQQARLAGVAVQRFMQRGLDARDLRAIGAGMLALAALGAWRGVGARPALAGLLTAGLLAPPLGRAALRAALPWLSRRYQLLPTIFFEAGPSLSEWTS